MACTGHTTDRGGLVAGDAPLASASRGLTISNCDPSVALIHPGDLALSLMIDLKHLRAFVAVAEALNIGRAADILQIQQSTLSRQITALEEEAGVWLFERHRGGMRLTVAGAACLAGTRRTLYEFERMVAFAGRSGRAEAGQITFGCFLSLSAGHQRELVSGFGSRYEDVEIDVIEAGREDLLARLRERQLDLAFLPGAMETPGLEQILGWAERFMVAVPETHPLAGKRSIAWPDLGGETVIVRAFEGAAQIRAFLMPKLAVGSGLQLRQHDVSRDTLINLVGLGQGIAIVTEAACGVEYPGIVFRPIDADDARSPIWLVWHPENTNPVLHRFVSFARKRKEAWMPQPAL
jgi:DNA-binding transcriptional LysR family regulator